MKSVTKKFWMLWIAAIISVAFVLPYAFNIQSELIKEATLPLPLLIATSIIQSGILFAAAVFFGLRLADKTGFSLPLLSSWIARKKIKYSRTAATSVLVGIIVGMIILALDRFIFQQAVTIQVTVPIWQGLLACFYGGIAEEVLMRLFLVSLFVFFLMKITDRKAAAVWISILLVSVLFGLSHLPFTSALVDITPLVILRAIVLNGIGGIVFGWLYWKKGLEAAIISHFSADIVLHVIARALFG